MSAIQQLLLFFIYLIFLQKREAENKVRGIDDDDSDDYEQ